MAVTIPTHDQIFSATPTAIDRSAILTPSTPGTKANGGLPLSLTASQWNVAYNSSGGYLFPIQGHSGTIDVSSNTKLLIWMWQHNAPNRIQVDTHANAGCVIRLASGAGSTVYRDFYVSGNDKPANSSQTGPVPVVVDLNASGADATSASDLYDNTDVQCYGLWFTGASLGGTKTNLCFVQRATIVGTGKNDSDIIKFTGTSDFDDIIDAVLGTGWATKIGTWVQKISDTYLIPTAFQIGDTSTATNFDCVGKTVVSPSNNDSADPRYRLTTQATRVYIVLRDNALDDADLDNSTWVWGVASPFDFDVNNASAITIDGAVFNGMGDFTLGSSVTGAATFTLATGSDVIISGADLDGSTINGDATLDVDTDFTDITINGNLDITIAADTVLDFSNVTVTGNVTNSAGSNTLTINASNGSSLTAGDAGTGNGETNIVNAVTLTVNVKDTSGSNIENARVLLEAEAGGAAPSDDSVTVSNVTTTATVTHTAHGMSTNDWVVIRGADDEYYNGIFQITVTTANAYTYTMSGTPTVDTGTITATQSYINELTLSTGIATENVNFGTDQPVRGVARKSSASPFYRTGSISGTITSAGFSTTITLILDE